MKTHTELFTELFDESQNVSDSMTSDLGGGDYAHLNERMLQIVDARDNQTIRMKNCIKMKRNQEW